jgi:hypothetical protein
MTESMTDGARASSDAVATQEESTTTWEVQGDAGWQRCFERLQAVYDKYEARDQSVFLFVMVDGRGHLGIDKLLSQVPELECTSLWADTAIESHADMAPYVIALDRRELANERSLQHRLARRLWREAAVPTLTWLWSPYDIEYVAAHYRSYLTYSLTTRQAYYLHFYDNRVLERLRDVWSEQQAQQFIAPCFEIGYRDRSFSDIAWENPVPPAILADEVPAPLTDDQHQLLIGLAYADKLTLHLRTQCGVRLAHFTTSELHQRVCDQLVRAGSYRLDDDFSLMKFLAWGLLVSPTFDEHPLIRERLLAVAHGEVSLVDALGDVADDAGRAILAEKTHA